MSSARLSWPTAATNVGGRLDEHLGLVVAAAACAGVAVVGMANGGYFSTTWGWIVLGLAWVVCVVLLLADDIAFRSLELATVGGLAIFVAWVAASIAWSVDRAQSVAELERDVVYVLAALAAVLVVRTVWTPHLLGGLLGAISAVDLYALATRLFPSGSGLDPIVLNQLSRPIGYPNGLGIFSVLGILLAVGFATGPWRIWARVAASAALPLVATTLYFTYSRGAWLALIVAAAVTLAIDSRRFELITGAAALLPASAAAIWVTAHQRSLTSLAGRLAQIRAEGRHELVLIAAATAASAASGFLVTRLRPRIDLSFRRRGQVGVLVSTGALVALVATTYVSGGPFHLARRAYRSFEAPPSSAAPQQALQNDLNRRLFSLNGTYRLEQWRAAWHEHELHALRGSGAGSFEQYWLQHRTVKLDVRDAHSLYMETLAELGWAGLGLLVIALAAPLVAAIAVRRSPLVPSACGAYAAYLLHTGIDWDWEVPAVTVSGLLCGVALLAAARGAGHDRQITLPMPVRTVTAAATVAIAVLSILGLIGNRALTAATRAVDAGEWRTGASQARTAVSWMPWSGHAWQQLGDAQLGLGQAAAARASLRRAVRKSPHDWSTWFDLGTVSRGEQRRDAYRHASALNPLQSNVRLLRRRGDL
jgi:O-antigen ligase